jgi:cell division septal protein FtsQ
MIILLLYFLYRIAIAFMPIDKACISYPREVTEGRKNEVAQIIKKVGLGNLKELEKSLESLSWVEEVSLSRNILRKLKIDVISRVPVARVEGLDEKVVDGQGFVFDADKSYTLPVVKLSSEVKKEGIHKVVELFDIIPLSEVDKIEVGKKGVLTRYKDLEIVWGSDEFDKKYEILKKILKNNKNEFKGRLDFRFKNMVILRR